MNDNEKAIVDFRAANFWGKNEEGQDVIKYYEFQIRRAGDSDWTPIEIANFLAQEKSSKFVIDTTKK